MRYSFSKQRRVLRGSEFTLALKKGYCAADGTLVLFAIATVNRSPPRLGVTIPKKMGGAVQRNRWKRLIRESFRIQQDQIPPGFDYIVRPKKDAKPVWKEIRKSLPRLAGKATRKHSS